jgi:hypothetical protein
MDSPFFSQIQHLSTTITFYFLRLSMVIIFPRAADQTKEATLERALVHQILLQEKMRAFTTTQDIVKGSDIKQSSLLEKAHQIISPPSRLTLTEYNKL